MAKQLDSIEVYPGENGGHRVVHNFKREVTKRGGAMSGGIYSERPNSEESNFSPGEEEAVMTHLRKALGFKGAKAEEGSKE